MSEGIDKFVIMHLGEVQHDAAGCHKEGQPHLGPCRDPGMPPPPSPDYPNDWCAYHQEIEPIPDNVYKICFECWHAFTKEELITETAKHYEEGDVTDHLRAEDITICPLCVHDF